MRIAILAPPWFPIPPPRYGGIEWVVALLADGLVEAGHDVTLFATGEARTRAKVVASFAEARPLEIGRAWTELRHAVEWIVHADDFDVLNDHTGPLGAVLGGLVSTPFLHTVHGTLTGDAGKIYSRIAGVAPGVGLVSISLNQRKPCPDLPWAANIPNALDLAAYPVDPHRGDYLLFLGRVSPDKGPHRAIEVANAAGAPLKIAGKMQDPAEKYYFEAEVRPRLGERIEYLGEVSHDEKVELLQNARATLFPIQWEEPFGLVMIESMACGTPVIATRRGAVPEVVAHGRSGIIVEDHRAMVAALEAADDLDPLECRRYVEEHFSPERMVRGYEEAYRAVLEPVAA
jgi:glycosyltransferase involved in cell wall biosynthesis